MTLAFIADIHANAWALQAVLDDIESRGIKLIYDLGDTLFGPLDPSATYRLLTEKQIQSICGNQDRFILENHVSSPTFDYVHSALRGTDALDWLKSLPATRVVENNILLCHGTPDNDSEYLLEVVAPDHIRIRKGDELAQKLAAYAQNIVLCGHSHLPGIVQADQKVVVNPGSVGLQAYQDDAPFYHKMESHSPLARYGVVSFTNELSSIELVALSYDVEKAAACAEKNHRQDWAHRLRKGYV